jgi:hypothetical protein
MTGSGVTRLSIVRERQIAHRARHIAVIASESETIQQLLLADWIAPSLRSSQ